MISRPVTTLLRASIVSKNTPKVSTTRRFSTTKDNKAKNRIFTPIRRPDDFSSYLLLSTSSRTPLLTFWTASYCQTCKTVLPLLSELIALGVGEEEGGVSLAEIEYDSMDIMDSGLGLTYMISSMPTLLSFDRGEPQLATKATDPKLLKDREWLKEWIRTEARRRGRGGGGGSLSNNPSLFGGLFGNFKQ